MRAQPPRTPARLDRLPAHRTAELDQEPDDVLEAARKALRGRRFRVQVTDDAISAERGYLRESGNLLFPPLAVVLLVAVAFGHLLGWRGDVIVPVGTTFSNTVSSLYDTIDAGPVGEHREAAAVLDRRELDDGAVREAGDPARRTARVRGHRHLAQRPGRRAERRQRSG